MGYRLLLIALLVLIVTNLLLGLVALISPRSDDRSRLVRALSFRIGLSLFAFVILLIGWAFGWWFPHSL